MYVNLQLYICICALCNKIFEFWIYTYSWKIYRYPYSIPAVICNNNHCSLPTTISAEIQSKHWNIVESGAKVHNTNPNYQTNKNKLEKDRKATLFDLIKSISVKRILAVIFNVENSKNGIYPIYIEWVFFSAPNEQFFSFIGAGLNYISMG